MVSRRSGIRLSMRNWRGLSTVGGAAFLLILLSAWMFGGFRTSQPYLPWDAVESLGTALTAAAAIVALAALVASFEQTRAARRTERQSLMPYLRVDVGIEGQEKRTPIFRPPRTPYIFSPQDFGEAMETGEISSLLPVPGMDSISVCIWVTNKQQAALGHAYNVKIELLLSWTLHGKEAIAQGRFASPM